MPGAPNPATANQNRPGYASPLQIAALWLKAGGPASQLPTAVAVALAESSGRTTASNRNTNGTTDHGIWQINDANLGPGGAAAAYASNITDPLANAQAAVAVWKQQGWPAWSTYNGQQYKTYYQQGVNAANVATSSTANQLAGALLPLLAIGGAGALAGADVAGLGSAAGKAASSATGLKGLIAAGGFAALLTDPKFLLRLVKIIGGAVLLLLGVRQLANAGGANIPGPGRLARAAV